MKKLPPLHCSQLYPTHSEVRDVLTMHSEVINGNEYEKGVHHIWVDNSMNTYPTGERSLTYYGEDLNEKPGASILYFPGFSENMRQVRDQIDLTLSSAKAAGYENPHLIGLDPCGRNTPEYSHFSNRISRIGLSHEFADVQQMVQIIDQKGHLAEDVFLMAHSLGYQNELATLEVLDQTRHNIRLIGLMPATDQPLGVMFSPKFWKTALKYSPEALWKFLVLEGALKVSYKDHLKSMFNQSEDHPDHYKLASEDSARRFINFVLTFKRRFKGVLESADLQAYLFNAKNDQLLPRNMAKKEQIYLESLGIPTKYFESEHFNHALPIEMNEAQKKEMTEFLGIVFGESAIEQTHLELPEYSHPPQPEVYIR